MAILSPSEYWPRRKKNDQKTGDGPAQQLVVDRLQAHHIIGQALAAHALERNERLEFAQDVLVAGEEAVGRKLARETVPGSNPRDMFAGYVRIWIEGPLRWRP